MRVCRKRAQCNYCPKPILIGNFMVVTKLSWRKDGKRRKWASIEHYHDVCWLRQGREALKRKEGEYVERRGRKAEAITDETRVERVRLLRQRASVMQRIRGEIEGSKEEIRVERIAKLSGDLAMLSEKIKTVGGAPESWTE